MRSLVLSAFIVGVAIGCVNVVNVRQPIRTFEDVTPNPGTSLRSAPGGVIVRIERSQDLPNAFGGRDIYGGKIALGYSELRFRGISSEGRAQLRSTDLRVQSAESTMTRYGAGGPLPTLDQTRSESPLEVADFVLDLDQSDELEFYGYRVRVRSVATHELVYDLEPMTSE